MSPLVPQPGAHDRRPAPFELSRDSGARPYKPDERCSPEPPVHPGFAWPFLLLYRSLAPPHLTPEQLASIRADIVRAGRELEAFIRGEGPAPGFERPCTMPTDPDSRAALIDQRAAPHSHTPNGRDPSTAGRSPCGGRENDSAKRPGWSPVRSPGTENRKGKGPPLARRARLGQARKRNLLRTPRPH